MAATYPNVPETTIFLSLLIVYAAAIAVGGWFVVRVESRQQWQQRAQRLRFRLSGKVVGVGSRMKSTTSGVQSRFGRFTGFCGQLIKEHKWPLLIASFLLLLPLAVAMLAKPFHMLEGYDDLPQARDPVIVALLQGEQLVPPPPLPPEVFVTKEVEAVRQALGGASREWMVLDADFRQRLLTVFQLMAKRGYQMALIEGYRSPERQAYLASLGAHVTNAKAFQSYHQYGLAADCAFFRNGKLIISEKDPWAMEGYRLYGEYAESVGLVWGGRWKMMDFGHVELRQKNVLGKRQ